MGAVKDFWNYIKGLMTGPEQEVTITQQVLQNFLDKEGLRKLSLYEFALNAGINIIANALSKCEFRTFVRGEEVRKDEYYLWNYQPNANMNASQFLQKLVWHLIYRNECLVIESASGELLIADTFQRDAYVYYPDVFRDIHIRLEGANQSDYTVNRSYRMDEVLYYRLNNRNITNLLQSIMGEYENLLQAAIQKFYKSGGERGVLNISANAKSAHYGKKADGTPRTYDDVLYDLMNNQFKNYFNASNAVMPLQDGFDYQTKGGEANRKSTSEVKDVTDIIDEVYGKVGNALQIPPAILKGDIADVSNLTRNLLTFAVDPIAKMIERENNRKRNGKKVMKGTYQMIDTSTIMHVESFDIADNAFNLIGSGYSVNEIRRKAGDAELTEEWADKHLISLNFAEYGAGEDRQGGDNEETVSEESAELQV